MRRAVPTGGRTMCFSAEADLVAGIVVGGIGVDALRHVTRRRELPLACVPLVLAVHQLSEAVVWRSLEGGASAEASRLAVWIYLLVAFCVVPILVPTAVTALEPPEDRRRMYAFVVLGVLVASVLLVAMVDGPVTALVQQHHIEYRIDLAQGGLVVALYVVATCVPMLLSQHRHMRWYGAVNLAAVAVLSWFATSAFISLWCVWAAITSVAIAAHLRLTDRATPPRLAHA